MNKFIPFIVVGFIALFTFSGFAWDAHNRPSYHRAYTIQGAITQIVQHERYVDVTINGTIYQSDRMELLGINLEKPVYAKVAPRFMNTSVIITAAQL